ncbi:MAG TPA: PAS domain S-box protein, partial [Candidatus Ozemobacteraceae bacterium]|nr:PAS domain S-box protein [Candidatus Ozemobacteraceae bacterium]
YLGKAVCISGAAVGSLCVVFQRDVVPAAEDLRVISIIASAIGTEESRRQAEIVLREREEKDRILFEVESDALFLIDNEDGKLIEANPAAVQLYGYSHEELLRMRNIDLSAEPQDTRHVTRSHQPDPGTVVNIPLRWHKRKDGTIFPVEITGRFFLQNGRGVHIAAIRDISHRQASEQALKDSEQNYRAIFDSTNEAIFIDEAATGRVIDVNASMLKMYGYDSKEEVLAGDLGDLSANEPPFTQKEASANVRKAIEVGPQIFEWLARKKSGERFWVEVSLRSVVIGGKQRVLAVVRDISERKRLEEQLIQSQKMESVGRLAGGVAHDFNNMLMVILGRCDLLLARLPADSPLRRDLLDIQQVATRSASLTQQLLAFARKQIIMPKVIQLNDVVEGMLRMLQRLIGEDIRLRWIPGPNLWNVKLDPAQVDQVLANLLVNARDAISTNGQITIETRNAPITQADRSAHPDLTPGEYVVLVVNDNGVGMTPDVIQKIFDPFYTTKDVGKGTGLGLATVYGIVQQNRGGIEVVSEAGKGSTFCLYFPRDVSHESKNLSVTDTPVLPTGTETIMLVEDDHTILALVQQLLEQLGYHVISSESPVAALAKLDAESGPVDLLLTDVIMPEMNGRQLFENMRKRRPAVRGLYMSGYTADVIADRGLLDESCNFIQKPFQAAEIAQKIRAILDRRGEQS